MSKKIIQMYTHDRNQVSIVEIYQTDKEQSLDYFFETYEEAKADMEFQNRVNDIVVRTSAIKEDIKHINSAFEQHNSWLNDHGKDIKELKCSLKEHIEKYNVFRRVILITNSIIMVILLIIAITG